MPPWGNDQYKNYPPPQNTEWAAPAFYREKSKREALEAQMKAKQEEEDRQKNVIEMGQSVANNLVSIMRKSDRSGSKSCVSIKWLT